MSVTGARGQRSRRRIPIRPGGQLLLSCGEGGAGRTNPQRRRSCPLLASARPAPTPPVSRHPWQEATEKIAFPITGTGQTAWAGARPLLHQKEAAKKQPRQ